MIWLLIVLLLLVLVLAAVLSPWRWPEVGGADSSDGELRHAATEVRDLEAARDGKYREIRDAEMDRETGKLSADDFSSVDAGLRIEAVEILQRLDRAQNRLVRKQRAAAPEESLDTSWMRDDSSESTADGLNRPDPVRPDRE